MEEPFDAPLGGDEPVDETADSAPKPDNGTYEVGYGKPPEHGKIKPGEVRNPRGKRPGTRSLKSDIREMLAMPVPMSIGKDKSRPISTQLAGLIKLREKALKGDSRSLDRLLEYAARFDEEDGIVASTGSLIAEDEEILANARQRDLEAYLANNSAARLLAAAPDTAEEE